MWKQCDIGSCLSPYKLQIFVGGWVITARKLAILPDEQAHFIIEDLFFFTTAPPDTERDLIALDSQPVAILSETDSRNEIICQNSITDTTENSHIFDLQIEQCPRNILELILDNFHLLIPKGF